MIREGPPEMTTTTAHGCSYVGRRERIPFGATRYDYDEDTERSGGYQESGHGILGADHESGHEEECRRLCRAGRLVDRLESNRPPPWCNGIHCASMGAHL